MHILCFVSFKGDAPTLRTELFNFSRDRAQGCLGLAKLAYSVLWDTL